MKTLSWSLLAIATFMFVSCSNDLSEVQTPSSEVNPSVDSRSEGDKSVRFIYHGKVYESNYVMLNDSVCLYQQPEVDELAQKFDQMQGLVSFCYPNKEIEYFDDEEDFQSEFTRIQDKVEYLAQNLKDSYYIIGHEALQVPVPYPVDLSNHDAELWLYDDVAYLDRREDLYLNHGEHIFEWAHLKDTYGMNDKTSSFIAFSIGGTTLFELYEDDHYKSHCMKFLLPRTGEISITGAYSILPNRTFGVAWAVDLRDCAVVGTKRSSWNDRITSVRLTRISNLAK